MDSQASHSEDILIHKAQQLESVDKLYEGIKFPTLLTRVKALLIDGLILLAIFTAASLIFDKVESTPDWVRTFVYIFMVFLYEPVLVSTIGSTLGHKAMGIKVKRYRQPDKNVLFPLALFRLFIKASLGWLSFLTITTDEHKRALHDKFSGSIVLFSK